MDHRTAKSLMAAEAADGQGAGVDQAGLPNLDLDDTHWTETPVVRDQLTNPKYKGTCKFMPPQVMILNLSNADDLKKYNELLAKAHPMSAPNLVLQRGQKPVCGVSEDGTHYWIIELWVYRVLYASTLSAGTEPVAKPATAE